MSWLRDEISFLRSALHMAFLPGRPPRGWLLVLLSTIGGTAAILWAIIRSAADRDTAFQEGHVGTYVSVALLFASAFYCQIIAGRLVQGEGRWWRWLRILLITSLFIMIVVAFVMFLAGDHLYGRRGYFFDGDRGGRKFWRALGGTAALGLLVAWRQPRRSFARFWILLSLLLLWVSLDDLLSFHEGFAENFTERRLQLPREHLVSQHLGDSLVAAYGLLALSLFLRFRRNIAQLPWMGWTFALAFVPYVVTVFADFGHWADWLEESYKVFSGALIFAALITAHLELRRAAARERGDFSPSPA